MADELTWQARYFQKSSEMPELHGHSAVVSLRSGVFARLLGYSAKEQELARVFGLIHDIGKVPSLHATGFHPVDGAAWAASFGDDELACLVAHHTGARYEARELKVQIPYDLEHSPLADIVHWCDLTTLQSGCVVGLDERRADIVERYGGGSTVVRALDAFLPEAHRTEERIMTAVGRTDPMIQRMNSGQGL